MAKRESERDRAKRWDERITAANRVYDAWAKQFEVTQLRRYYEGQQYRGLTDEQAKDKYVINLIFPTIETQQPALLFYRPKVKIDARPGHADDANSQAPARASLCESTVQTYIDDPKVAFKDETILALRDAPFLFSVVEVGYSADWIENPSAGKPLLAGDGKEIEGTQQPAKVVKPGSETLYVKRIPPQTYRVSLSGNNLLERNDWAGYYEWHYVEDLKANARYSNTANVKPSATIADGQTDATTVDSERQKHSGMVKVWKIWDLRAKTRFVKVDGATKFLLEDEPFAFLPHAVLKFFERSDEFYPLPPVFNWLDPQDEINESRDMQKVHRQRFKRRYTYRKEAIDKTELDKLETGEDGVYAEAKEANPIEPVPDAPLDGSTWTQLAATKEDFNFISGASSEARGVPQADTATQANIIEGHSQVRESSARSKVGDWLAGIARLMLLTLRAKMQLPFWVALNNDPFAGDQAALAQTAVNWKRVTSKELGDLDVDVKVDIASLSPVSLEAERFSWNQVLALLTNPALLMLLMEPNPQSPDQPSPLLRKTLGYYNIKSDTEVKEIWRVGQSVVQKQQLAAAAAALGGGKGGPAALPGMPGPAGTPAGIPAPARGSA